MRKRFYHRWLIFILCIGLLWTNKIDISRVAASSKGTVTADTLNVRTEPSTSAHRTQLSDGTYVYLRMDETVTI